MGLVHSHLAEDSAALGDEARPRAVLRPQPAQAFREIEVPDDYAKLTLGELHQRVIEHLKGPTAG